jgi:hypothetical protein
MAVDSAFGRTGDVVAVLTDYSAFYSPQGSQLPGGGLAGQMLVKGSNTSFDGVWVDPVVTGGTGVTVVPATKTKITYNGDGVITAGDDATTADINSVVDKRYVTDAQLTKLANTTGVNTGDQDLSTYALLSDLGTTNTQLANLSASLANYALASDLAATNINVAANTAEFANYATLTDLQATNDAIAAVNTNLANYATLDQVNVLTDNYNTLMVNLTDPEFIATSTAAEVKLTFSYGLTRDDNNNVTCDLVTETCPMYAFWGNSAPFDAIPSFAQIAAEYLSNGVTGSGKVVLDTSPSIDTPILVGPANVRLSDSGVSTAPTVFVVEHDFVGGGSIVAGFGATLEFRGRSTTTSGRTQGAMRTVWTNPTDGSRTSNMVFSPVNLGIAVDTLWLHGDGSAALGANAGSGNGVLFLQGGVQMPGTTSDGMVLRSQGGTFVPSKLDAADVSGQVSTCPTVKTTTTDQTTTTEMTHFSIPIAAGSVVGTTWKITLWGNADCVASLFQAQSYLRWGGLAGTLITNSSLLQSSATAQTNRDWRNEFLITITSVGTNGTARATVVTHEHTSLGTGAIVVGQITTGATDVVNVNTTIATTLVVTWAIAAAPAGVHVRTFGGVAELIRK